MRKRLLSYVLTICMVLAMIPAMNVYAAADVVETFDDWGFVDGYSASPAYENLTKGWRFESRNNGADAGVEGTTLSGEPYPAAFSLSTTTNVDDFRIKTISGNEFSFIGFDITSDTTVERRIDVIGYRNGAKVTQPVTVAYTDTPQVIEIRSHDPNFKNVDEVRLIGRDNGSGSDELDFYLEQFTYNQIPTPAETTPTTTFSFDGENADKLIGTTAQMQYSLDGGGTWVNCSNVNTDLNSVTASITEGNDIKIRHLGNGTTTTDSDIQTIEITKAATPTTAGKTDCTTIDNNDGRLTGVTAAMEYKLSTSGSWTAGTGSDITGLANGTYYVRVKATGTVIASEAQSISISAYASPVAKIGATEYTSLQAAFDAITSGQTVELLSDVTLASPLTIGNKGFTLDLKGKIIDGVTDTAIRLSPTWYSGTLTITGGGIITSAYDFTIELENYKYGILDVVNSEVKNTSTGNQSPAIYNGGHGAVTISGESKVSADQSPAIINHNDGGLTISGNAVITSACLSYGTIRVNHANSADTSLVITGGRVENTNAYGNAIYNENISKISVSGGEISGYIGIENWNTGTISVSGGIVSAAGAAIDNNSSGKIIISGNAVITSTEPSTSNGTICLRGGTSSDTVLQITGGTIENTSGSNGIAINNKAAGIVTISGGAITPEGRMMPLTQLTTYATVSSATAVLSAGKADYTLSQTPAPTPNRWLVYSGTSGETLATDVTATISGSTLSLSGSGLTAGTYRVAAYDRANGKGASTTRLQLTVTAPDTTAPSGYSVNINQAAINNANKAAMSFTFSGAEVGATYNYTVSSSGGGTNVTGSGIAAGATDQITGIDTSTLADGTLILSVTLTDTAGNAGAAATDTVNKDAAAPSGYSVNIDQAAINNGNRAAMSFTFSGAEVGAAYSYTVSSSGGAGSVTGNGTITSASQQIAGINTGGLADGTLTLSATLTDAAGNLGIAATDTVNKDAAAPSGYGVNINQAAIDNTNKTAMSFTFSGAEVGATYNYTVSSSGGGANVTGSGIAAGAADQISGIDTSTLADGTLTLSVTLTDAAGNAGAAATDTVSKDVGAPSGYSVSIDQVAINNGNKAAMSFTFGGAEVGAAYNYSVSSSGGAGSVTGSGIITGAIQQITGINVGGLADGTLTLSVTLTDGAGNGGTAATDTVGKDTTAPIVNSFSPANNANTVSINADMIITFDESVTAVTGKNIIIKKASDNSTVESIDAADIKVTGSGSTTITINPAAALQSSTGYYIQIEAGAFKDANNNDYEGIANTTTWSFTTASAGGGGGGGGGGGTSTLVTKIESGDTVAGANVDKLVKEGKALTVEGKTGEKLVFDTEALKNIDGQTKDSVKVEIKDVSADYKNEHPDRLVVSLSITAGGKHITSFGNGTATVSLPYELKAGEKAADVTVWYLAEDGTMTEVPCTYDPATKLATFKVNHFSLYVVGTADTSKWTNPFSDIKESSWYYDAVRYVSANEMMQGTSDTTFKPGAKTTRGMIVTILWRMENKPKAAKDVTFTDVKNGKYYHDAVAWASEKGIVGGYSAEKFGPEDNITREQLAVILYKYAVSKGYKTDAAADLSTFGDAGKAHSWSKDSLNWASGKGLIKGSENNLLDPLGAAERAQVAAILQRFVENIAK